MMPGAPDPTTDDHTRGRVDDVARAHHEAWLERLARAQNSAGYEARGWPVWDECPAPYRADTLRAAREWLAAMGDAGLAVVELPGPDGWTECVGQDGEDSRTPYWRLSWGESTTAWIEGVEVSAYGLREDLDQVSLDALKMLATVEACRRFQAEHSCGDPR